MRRPTPRGAPGRTVGVAGRKDEEKIGNVGEDPPESRKNETALRPAQTPRHEHGPARGGAEAGPNGVDPLDAPKRVARRVLEIACHPDAVGRKPERFVTPRVVGRPHQREGDRLERRPHGPSQEAVATEAARRDAPVREEHRDPSRRNDVRSTGQSSVSRRMKSDGRSRPDHPARNPEPFERQEREAHARPRLAEQLLRHPAAARGERREENLRGWPFAQQGLDERNRGADPRRPRPHEPTPAPGPPARAMAPGDTQPLGEPLRQAGAKGSAIPRTRRAKAPRTW